VQAVNVYGIFGALVIVLSNERDSPCIRMVALNAMTENLQMAGKWSVTEYLQMAGKWLLWVGCVYDNFALCESNMSGSCTELDLQACVD
jgi:hypothetical protein